MQRKETLCTVGRNVNQYSHYGTQHGGSSKNLRDPTLWSSNSISGYLSKETENTNSKRYLHPTSTAVLFTIAKIWKWPQCSSTDEWIKQLWLTTHSDTHRGLLFSLKREQNLAICDNMDGSWRNQAKWNETNRERQIPCAATYTWNHVNPWIAAHQVGPWNSPGKNTGVSCHFLLQCGTTNTNKQSHRYIE